MRKQLTNLAPFLIFVGIWQAYTSLNPHYEFFLGSPFGVLAAGTGLFNQGILIESFLITFCEVIIGYFAALLIGNLLGIAFWAIPKLTNIIRIYLIAVSSIPLFALAPIIIFSVGTGFIAKALIVFFSCVFLIIFQSFTGAKAVAQDYNEIMMSLRATKWQSIQHVVLPGSAVWVIAGSKLSIGSAIVGVFVAELISSSSGLGYIYIVAEGLFNVNQIWVAIIGYISIAFIVNVAIFPIEKMATTYKKG